MPSTPRHRDPDPLGLAQDMAGFPGPLLDWKLIARLKLPFAQIVKHFGNPPAAARRWFKVTASTPAIHAESPLRKLGESAAGLAATVSPKHRHVAAKR
jgi:hypothetical protein